MNYSVIACSFQELQKISFLAGSGDILFSSPPYNADVPYDSYNDKLTHKEYMQLARELGDFASFVLKPGAPMFLNVAPVRDKPFEVLDFIRKIRGWRIQNWITWLKNGTTPTADGEHSWGQFTALGRSKKRLHSTFEWVFQMVRETEPDVELDRLSLGVPYADKANLKRFNHDKDLRCRGNTWCIRYETKHKRTHPAPFPPQLARNGILLAGLESNSVVFDPFCGEGHTGVAALQLGHNFIGCDLSPNYVATANEKLERIRNEQLSL